MSLDGFKTHSVRIFDHLQAKTFSQAVVWKRRYVMRWQKERSKELTGYVVPLEKRFDAGSRQRQEQRYFLGVYLLQSMDDATTEDEELTKVDELNLVLDEIEAACAELRKPTTGQTPILLSSEVPRESVDFEIDDTMTYFAGIVLEAPEV